MTSVSLTFGDVGNMNLNHGNANGADAVGKGDGGVCVGTRVHHHSIVSAIGLLQLVDEIPLVIRLEISKLVMRILVAELPQIVLKSELPINLRLSFAKQIEVGTVDNQNVHRSNFFAKICFS